VLASKSTERNATQVIVEREAKLQTLVTVYITTGLVFLLLPGTFLGVWNLLSISAHHTVAMLPAAWIQAHGHAQIFGWLGTFILGIGFYSLSKMGNLPSIAVSRGWLAYFLWTAGVLLRWLTGVASHPWLPALPIAALLELAGFLVFFRTVSGHRPAPSAAPGRTKAAKPTWMLIVIASTTGFLLTMLFNLAVSVYVATRGAGAAVPGSLDQRLLMLPVWGFLVPTVWGFNTRWLPTFLGLRPPRNAWLYAACLSAFAAVAASAAGLPLLAASLLLPATAAAITGLRIFEPSIQPAKLNGVHLSFPAFIRLAYVWMIVATSLGVFAALADRHHGIWGASRHAITVGFLATMVFAIGQRILPAFCGAHVLFSRGLMLASLVLLNLGCSLRVLSEVLAYENYVPWMWRVLPVSAIIELTAVAVFAANLVITFLRPPAHLVTLQPLKAATRP
jgi:uncharacterized protein involved in response to NO